MVPATVATLNRVVRDLLQPLRSGFEFREMGLQRYRLHPGKSLEHLCCAPLLAPTVKLKLEAFRQQWHAQCIKADLDHHTYQVRIAGSFWQRWGGNLPGIEVDLHFRYPLGEVALTRVHITLRPINCDSFRSAELLDDLGLRLLEELRGVLQAYPERRKQERFALDQTITLYPLHFGGRLGEAITAQTRNLSMTGIGLSLADKLPGRDVCIQLRSPGSPVPPLAVPGRVVYSEANLAGFFDTGVCFTVGTE